MKHILIPVLVVLLAACGTPPAETVRVFQSPTASLAPRQAEAQPLPTVEVPTDTLVPTLPPTLTPEPSATPNPPWRFVVFGDTRTSGLDPPAMMGQLVELARLHQPAAVIVVGDLVNAMDDKASVREQWKRWRATIAPLGEYATDPWMLVTPGNHDVQNNAWATDLMAEAFPELPENGPAGLKRLVYRYDIAGVRFISVHSEIFGDQHRIGPDQLTWLETQLQDNPNAYTFVYSHDPAFPIGPHIGSSLDSYPAERDQFWALLKQYGVTAYIAGHEHLYNRQTIDGVVQLIVGTSGSFPYSGFGGDFYHYLFAEVTEDGVLMVVYDSQGQERDRFVLN
jgi:3',5'-cyclic-AMP phosphodiesterase